MKTFAEALQIQSIVLEHLPLTDSTVVDVKATEFNSICAMLGTLIDYLIHNAIFTPEQMENLVEKGIESGLESSNNAEK
jgi:hypothetical protein